MGLKSVRLDQQVISEDSEIFERYSFESLDNSSERENPVDVRWREYKGSDGGMCFINDLLEEEGPQVHPGKRGGWEELFSYTQYSIDHIFHGGFGVWIPLVEQYRSCSPPPSITLGYAPWSVLYGGPCLGHLTAGHPLRSDSHLKAASNSMRSPFARQQLSGLSLTFPDFPVG